MVRYGKFIDNWIYFGHLDKWAVLPTYPESISDSMSSNFAQENALSRSAPVFTYSNSGPRTIDIELPLHRDMMEEMNLGIGNLRDNLITSLESKDYVDVLIRYIQACSVPKYSTYSSGAKAVEPPWVAVKFGSDVFIKGVIQNINANRSLPIMRDGKYASVTVHFQVSEIDPYDAVSISNKGSFRGITSTFKNGIYKEG